MIRCVVGLMFSEDRKRVVLVKYNGRRFPPYKGLWNGVGGHVEEVDPSPLAAMRREFREETGVTWGDWDLFCDLIDGEYRVYFYRAFDNDATYDAQTVEDQEIKVHYVHDLAIGLVPCAPNLHWLLPLALNANVRIVNVISVENTTWSKT